MRSERVTVIGGSGFVGCRLVQGLADRGLQVVVPTRNRERAKRELIVLPTVDVVSADVHSAAVLERLLAGSDAVVNLAGILHASRQQSFERVHVELPLKIAHACRSAGVQRMLHMSALGAARDAPSEYLRSKGEGEARLRAAAGDDLQVTVFRPSVIFGAGDSFLGMFARLQRLLPLMLLGSPRARFQPVWVEDVACAFAAALDERETFGHAYELCGPKVYTLRELVELAGRLSGHARPIIGLGPRASYWQAALFELSPVKILTRDNVRSMSIDSVCGCDWPPVFGFPPSALEAIAPGYLSPAARRPYDGFRARAGR
jgi:NADH dehydrogenase